MGIHHKTRRQALWLHGRRREAGTPSLAASPQPSFGCSSQDLKEQAPPPVSPGFEEGGTVLADCNCRSGYLEGGGGVPHRGFENGEEGRWPEGHERRDAVDSTA